jgi:polyphosphate kinase 2 (PPK2 family)
VDTVLFGVSLRLQSRIWRFKFLQHPANGEKDKKYFKRLIKSSLNADFKGSI